MERGIVDYPLRSLAIKKDRGMGLWLTGDELQESFLSLFFFFNLRVISAYLHVHVERGKV